MHIIVIVLLIIILIPLLIQGIGYLLYGIILAAVACFPPLLGALLIHSLAACLVGFAAFRRVTLRELVTEHRLDGILCWIPASEAIERVLILNIAIWGGTIFSVIWLVTVMPAAFQHVNTVETGIAAFASLPLCVAALYGMQKLTAKGYSQFWFEFVERKVGNANEELGKAAHLRDFERQNRELAAKLSTDFPIDYSSESEDFVARNHDNLPTSSELRSELGILIAKGEQVALAEQAELKRAITAYEDARASLKAATRIVQQTGIQYWVREIVELDQALDDISLAHFITKRAFEEFHCAVAQIQEQILLTERSAQSGVHPDGTEENTSSEEAGAEDTQLMRKKWLFALGLEKTASKEDVARRRKELQVLLGPLLVYVALQIAY